MKGLTLNHHYVSLANFNLPVVYPLYCRAHTIQSIRLRRNEHGNVFGGKIPLLLGGRVLPSSLLLMLLEPLQVARAHEVVLNHKTHPHDVRNKEDPKKLLYGPSYNNQPYLPLHARYVFTGQPFHGLAEIGGDVCEVCRPPAQPTRGAGA
ncbi:hypothetical protein GN244_ATG06725 [Phytophthora infestans]|uniref:Uncharacterized protein n=1 Tax=Phytophthora infestans TaxID=4787 RepID=A0A833W3K7_PHYIN|nr:hypothetical protein GN244_ATG06725 [Phytophthora infestans]